MAKIKQGPVEDFENFTSAVINQHSFDKITSILEKVKTEKNVEIISGGGSSSKTGYYIEPTAIVTTNPKSLTMTTELFGPVVTLYVYPSAEYEETVLYLLWVYHYRCD
jgi:1-pyrroline-5-carboxylate dehydrogenase